MDLAKFVALLSQKGIYFPRVDSLDDKFEGALGLASREADYDQFYLDYYRKIVVSPPPGYPIPDWSDEEIEKQAQRLLRETKDGGAHERNSLVSCWHANDSESEAQWRLYCPAMTVGVAIRSDVGRLWEAIRGEYMGVVGKIRYIDFKKEYAHNYRTVFFKRNSLSHEREVRAVIPNNRKEPSTGRLVSCDIENLVESITISPFSPSWSLPIVESLVAKYGFSIKVGGSELTEKPFF